MPKRHKSHRGNAFVAKLELSAAKRRFLFMKTKTQKAKIMDNLSENLKKAKIIIFADFHGLNIAKMNILRKELKKIGSHYEVVKKSLLKKTLEALNLKDIDLDPKAKSWSFITSSDDMLGPAKIVYNFGKKEKLEIIGGIFENKNLAKSSIVDLAKIPSYEALMTRLVGLLKMPIRQLAVVLSKIEKK